jgi:tetratricopeptide (TPR) repeat protein
MAYCLNLLGEIALALGDVSVAQHHVDASYRLRQEFNDPEGIAVALNHLGKIALQQKHYERAQQLYQKSLDIYQNIFKAAWREPTKGWVRLQAGRTTFRGRNNSFSKLCNWRQSFSLYRSWFRF